MPREKFTGFEDHIRAKKRSHKKKGGGKGRKKEERGKNGKDVQKGGISEQRGIQRGREKEIAEGGRERYMDFNCN